MPFRFVALFAATTALVLGCALPASAGELQQTDRTLLARLKQHSLWATPASRLAAERATNRRVRAVAVRIADDQARLDVALRAVADRLAVTLPAEPTEQERGWAAEISGWSEDASDGFDRAYVNRLRAEYGSLFGLASDVRAGTRDDDVRAFAQTAVDTSLGHLTLLESTGLAETTSLLVSATEDDTLAGGDVALGAGFVAFAAVATFGLLRLLGTPGRTQPRTRR
jgi:putative membrane protein